MDETKEAILKGNQAEFSKMATEIVNRINTYKCEREKATYFAQVIYDLARKVELPAPYVTGNLGLITNLLETVINDRASPREVR